MTTNGQPVSHRADYHIDASETSPRNVRVSLTWPRQSAYAPILFWNTLVVAELSGYRLTIFDPDGIEINSSDITYSNYEIVQFKATKTGAYRIEVTTSGHFNVQEHFSVAVSIDDPNDVLKTPDFKSVVQDVVLLNRNSTMVHALGVPNAKINVYMHLRGREDMPLYLTSYMHDDREDSYFSQLIDLPYTYYHPNPYPIESLSITQTVPGLPESDPVIITLWPLS